MESREAAKAYHRRKEDQAWERAALAQMRGDASGATSQNKEALTHRGWLIRLVADGPCRCGEVGCEQQ